MTSVSINLPHFPGRVYELPPGVVLDQENQENQENRFFQWWTRKKNQENQENATGPGKQKFWTRKNEIFDQEITNSFKVYIISCCTCTGFIVLSNCIPLTLFYQYIIVIHSFHTHPKFNISFNLPKFIAIIGFKFIAIMDFKFLLIF